MNKAVLISIQPKWCELIASGRKTIEVRKTKPKLQTPFKCYIYQTKRTWIYNIYSKIADWQRKVIGEFVCDEIECFTTDYRQNEKQTKRISLLSCVSMEDLIVYEKTSYCLYGWHISELKIYDKPKELGDFYKPAVCGYTGLEPAARPPQSWCYVEFLDDEL